MKKILTFILITVLIIPNLVLASWWNPFTWFNKLPSSEKIDGERPETKLPTPTTTSISTTFYVKYDNSRIRKCLSTDCDVIGHIKINTEMIVRGDRIYKLNDLPEWMEYTDPDGLRGYVNKSILSENPVETPSVVQQNTNQTPKNSSVSKNNTDSSNPKDVAIDLVDMWINNQEWALSYIDQYSKDIDYWENRFSEIREATQMLVDNATDPYLISQSKYIIQICDGLIKFGQSAKNGLEKDHPELGIDSIQNLLKYVDEHVIELKKYRARIPELYTNEEVSKEELSKLLSVNTNYKLMILDKTHSAEEIYLDVVGEGISRKDETISKLKSYFSKNNVSNAVIDTPIYKPMVIPQIQIPKTTNCTMGPMSGARGYYTVSCY